MLATLAPIALPATAATSSAADVPSWEARLVTAAEPGAPLVVEGRVVTGPDQHGVRDALVYVYNMDNDGHYSPGDADQHPRLEGILRTSVTGGFRVRTIVPGNREGVPHLHFAVRMASSGTKAATLNLCRAEGPGSDRILARLPYILELPDANWANVRRDAEGVYRCHWDFPWDQAIRAPRPDAFERLKR